MTKALLTFGVGDQAELLALTRPAMERYAARHGYDFLVAPCGPQGRPPSWGKVPALQSALRDHDEVLWIDADCLVVDDSEDLAAEVPPEAWQALRFERNWRGDVVPNCGVWLLRRPMLPVLTEAWEYGSLAHCPYWEQDAICALLGFRRKNRRRIFPPAAENELYRRTHRLAPRWNVFPGNKRPPAEPARIRHAAGGDFFKKRRLLRQYQQESQMKNAPYDFAQYGHVWKSPGWSVDKRHIYWMHDILASRRWGKTLEIGSLHGATATAFVEAANAGHIERAYFCDVNVKPGLEKTLGRQREPERRRILRCRSAEALAEHGPFDFVFVDGDHRLPTVIEETRLLLEQGTPCVMAHDTSSHVSGIRDCEGPQHLKLNFQATAPYLCLEENYRRGGEATHRGMFFATRDAELFETARECLRRWIG